MLKPVFQTVTGYKITGIRELAVGTAIAAASYVIHVHSERWEESVTSTKQVVCILSAAVLCTDRARKAKSSLDMETQLPSIMRWKTFVGANKAASASTPCGLSVLWKNKLLALLGLSTPCLARDIKYDFHSHTQKARHHTIQMKKHLTRSLLGRTLVESRINAADFLYCLRHKMLNFLHEKERDLHYSTVTALDHIRDIDGCMSSTSHIFKPHRCFPFLLKISWSKSKICIVDEICLYSERLPQVITIRRQWNTGTGFPER